MVFLSTKEGDHLLIHWTEAATLASMLALASDRIKATLDSSSDDLTRFDRIFWTY